MSTEQPEVPARYRVREPVTLDAIRWTGGNAEAVREFGAVPDFIPVGCWVLRGVTGHVFTVDAERFAAIYEPAGEEEAPSVSSPPVAAALDREAVSELVRAALAPGWQDDGHLAEMAAGAIWPLLENAQSAAAGSHEGVRLWMLDCGELVAKHRARAQAADAKLAELRSVLLEGGQEHGIVRRRALGIIGSEGEAGNGDV